MATTEPEILELYRVSLTNAGSQPAIAQILAEYGYGPEKLEQGWALLAEVGAATWQSPHDAVFPIGRLPRGRKG